MFQEFKKFIAKGNVIELAVGLIMATYFGAIVKSLVDDIIMPPVGMLTAGVDFSTLKYVIKDAVPAELSASGVAVPAVSINYGTFINTIITFIIVAFAIFMVVKAYNSMKERMERQEPKLEEPKPTMTQDQQLLAEIRDLLKNSPKA